MTTLSPEYRLSIVPSVQQRWIEESDTLDSETVYQFFLNGTDFGYKVVDGTTRQQFLRDLFAINRAIANGDRPQLIVTAVQKLGEVMYRLLIPGRLRRDFFEAVPESILTLDTVEHDLPWELLHDGRTFLSLRHAFGRDIAPISVTGQQDRRKAIHVCLIGNPSGDLTSADAEIDDLERIIAESLDRLTAEYMLQTTLKVLRGREATKREVLQHVLLSDTIPWDIIHFAGHGAFEGTRPDSSALRLHDGDLKGFEVEEMKVRPVFFANACHSGVSGRENTLLAYSLLKGLGPAFLRGGANAYIGALWPVNDGPAREFAVAFYTSVIDGASIGQAIRSARSIVWENHPSDVTPLSYVLCGDPRRRLALYEPELTAGPYINERGLLRVFEIERQHSRLELLLVNDLPWILWQHEDFIRWVGRMSVSAESRNNMVKTLFEYRRYFRQLVVAGQKTFRGIVNLRALRRYVAERPQDLLKDLMNDLAKFGVLPNFELLLYEGHEEELEEIELVSEIEDVLTEPSRSVYVFNKQTRFERAVSYHLFEEFNPTMIKEYAARFFHYRDLAINQYRLRWTEREPQVLDSPPNSVVLNRITSRILWEEVGEVKG
jgi:CHAT domain